MVAAWKQFFQKRAPEVPLATLAEIRAAIEEPGDDATELEKLLSRAPDLNASPEKPVFPISIFNGMAISDHSTYPIVLASMLYKPSRVTALIKHGVRTDVKCGHGRTALHWALVGSADSNLLLSSRYPQLAIDAENQAASLACVRALLEHGVDVNTADGFKMTPLHRACMVGGKSEHIRLLIARGAALDPRATQSVTPLMIAVQNGLVDTAVILLQAGAKPNIPDSKASTPLHWACGRGNAEIVEALLKSKADPSMPDGNGNTPVQLAISSGSLVIMRLLLDAGADAELPANWQQNIMMNALQQRNFSTLNTMLEVLDINAGDVEGVTLLHRAVSNGVPAESIFFLLDRGALLEAEDVKHRRPLHYAAGLGMAELITALVSRGANLEAGSLKPLHFAATSGHLAAAKALLDAGAKPQSLAGAWETPIISAIEHGHFDIAKLLAEALVPLGGLRALPGFSPLITVAEKGNVEMAKVLLEFSPDMEATTRDGWTALHEAVAHSDELVQLLLSAGANPNASSETGYTPLQRAVSKGRADIVQLLLRNGADPQLSDISGNTLIEFASASANPALIEAVAKICKPAASRTAEEHRNRVQEILLHHISRAPSRLRYLREIGAPPITGNEQGTEQNPFIVKWKGGLGTGVAAMYEFLDNLSQAKGGWSIKHVSRVDRADRHIHRMEIYYGPQKAELSVFFDITECAAIDMAWAGFQAHLAMRHLREN